MSTNTRGKAETQTLKKNLEDQLSRLLAQLQDLEDSKAELDVSEYDDMKADTLAQVVQQLIVFALMFERWESSKLH